MLCDSGILEEVLNDSLSGVTDGTLTKEDKCIVLDKDIGIKIEGWVDGDWTWVSIASDIERSEGINKEGEKLEPK